jgi:hypothetical protein
MGDVQPDETEPQIELRQLSAERTGPMGSWKVVWLLRNKGPRPLQIQAVRLPHGQFKSAENRFEPAVDLKPNEETQFQTLVRCDEPPGDVTENAFVIFYVTCLKEPWRVFVRIKVVVSSSGKPQTTTELITTQKAGFSRKDLP